MSNTNNEKKYASLSTLQTFLDNLKTTFSAFGHKHTLSDITDYAVDSELSSTSTAPVQNKVLNAEFDEIAVSMRALETALDGKSDSSHDHNSLYYTETEIDQKLSAVNTSIDNIKSGEIVVKEAEHAGSADSATTANSANYATTAGSADNATHAESADSATNANHASTADSANHATTADSATSATKATQDASGNVITSTYETKTDATAKLNEAKEYANSAASSAANTVKNDLLNGAGAAYDTLKELSDLINENQDAIDALETVAANKADKVHSHVISDITDLAEATQTASGLLSASDKIQLDMGGIPIVTTSGTGTAYTATIDGMTLTAGASFMMIPHTVSTTTAPTLNVNGLGAKNIRRRLSSATTSTTQGYNASWLSANKPIRVEYDGTFWIADLPKPSAADLSGTLAVTQGGTGATDAATARENLEITPANIGAAAEEHAHAISDVTDLQVELDTLTENKSDKTHTHADATTTASGMMSSDDKVKLDSIEERATNGIQRVNMTSEDGIAYTATIDGLEELTTGMTFLFIPDKTSAATTCTLNVNGFGDMIIRRKLSMGMATGSQNGISTQFYKGRATLLMFDDAVGTNKFWYALDFTKPCANDLYGSVPVQLGGTYVNSNTTEDDIATARENLCVYSKAEQEMTLIYDSGEITEAVNSISGINISGYNNIHILAQNVNDGTNTTSGMSGIAFTATNGTVYLFPAWSGFFHANSGKNTCGMAHFKLMNGWLAMEHGACSAAQAKDVFDETEGGSALKCSVHGGGAFMRCTNELSTMALTSSTQSESLYLGVGSRVMVWGCKV